METKNVKSRLSEDSRKEIFSLHEKGVPVSKLSQQFKVSRPTIYTILEEVRQTQNEFFIKNDDENKDNNMEHINLNNTKINFLGVTIDTENGSSNPKVRKALDKSFKLLDIMEFIEVTKFKLNMVMFDYFWQVVVGNQSSLVGRLVLEWFGYEGEYFNQKKCFKKMLKNNSISFRELTQKDKEIEDYPTFKHELQLLPHEGARACAKFLIMEPKDLKMAIMQLKTKNGHIIRQYYIDLEELLKTYVEYTLYFNHRESQRKITDLEQMMANMNLTMKKQEEYMRSLGISLEEVKDQNEELLDSNKGLEKNVKCLEKQNSNIQRKLGIAVEDRAPLPANEDKQERFVLLKRNDSQHYQYYTIRAQFGYTERRIRTQRTLFPDMEILLDFKANPNSKTLYNRIKDELKAKNVQFSGNNIDLEESEVTQEELVNEMMTINDQKYNVQ
jgi:hypothetical protein